VQRARAAGLIIVILIMILMNTEGLEVLQDEAV